MAKLDPYKFTSGEKPHKSNRPLLCGVYHDKGNVIATDAHIMLIDKQDYPKKNEGKVIAKDGTVIEGHFPSYKNVIPDMKLYTPYRIDVDAISEKLKGVKKRNVYYVLLVPEDTGLNNIRYYDSSFYGTKMHGTPGSAAYDLDLFKKLIYYMKAKKTDTIMLKTEDSQARPGIVKTADGLAFIMPIKLSDWPEAVQDGFAIVARTKEVGIVPKNMIKNVPTKKQTQTSKTNTTMRKSVKKTSRGASSTSKKASRILKEQKKEYQSIFRSEVKKSRNPQAGAKKAGKIYRDRYGATPKARWKNALKKAK